MPFPRGCCGKRFCCGHHQRVASKNRNIFTSPSIREHARTWFGYDFTRVTRTFLLFVSCCSLPRPTHSASSAASRPSPIASKLFFTSDTPHRSSSSPVFYLPESIRACSDGPIDHNQSIKPQQNTWLTRHGTYRRRR